MWCTDHYTSNNWIEFFLLFFSRCIPEFSLVLFLFMNFHLALDVVDIYRYQYILLSPDAERPPAQTLARTGALYEISDLREIYGAGT